MSLHTIRSLRQAALSAQLDASLDYAYGAPDTPTQSPGNDLTLSSAATPASQILKYHNVTVLQLVTNPQFPPADANYFLKSYNSIRHSYHHNTRHNIEGRVNVHAIYTPSQLPKRFYETYESYAAVIGEHDQILSLYTPETTPLQLDIIIHDEFDPNKDCSFSPQIFRRYLELINPGSNQPPQHTISHVSLIGQQSAIKRFLQSRYGTILKDRYGNHHYLIQKQLQNPILQPTKGWLGLLRGTAVELQALLKGLNKLLLLSPQSCEADLTNDQSIISSYLSADLYQGNLLHDKVLDRLQKIKPHWPHPQGYSVYRHLADLIDSSGLTDNREAQSAAQACRALHELHFFNPENPAHQPLRKLVENAKLVIGLDPIDAFNREFYKHRQAWLEVFTENYQKLKNSLKSQIYQSHFSLAGFVNLPNTPSDAQHAPLTIGVYTSIDPLKALWSETYRQTAAIKASTRRGGLQPTPTYNFPYIKIPGTGFIPDPALRNYTDQQLQLPLSPVFAPPIPTIPPAGAPLKIALPEGLKPRFEHTWAEAQIELDNILIQRFNPALDKPTGIKDATLAKPVLEKSGLEAISAELSQLGYELSYSPQTEARLARKTRQAVKATAPLYPLTEYEKNAYYQYGPAEAQNTVTDPETGQILWQQGKSYQITPSWEKTQVEVDTETEVEELPENAREIVPAGHSLTDLTYNRTTTRTVEYGYLTFLVGTETGTPIKIREIFTRADEGQQKEQLAEELQAMQERETAILQIPEADRDTNIRNELSHLTTRITATQARLAEPAITIETFNETFPPPTPPLTSERFEEEIRHNLIRIRQRFSPHYPDIKDYQLRIAGIASIKRATANGSPMGAGKTLMSIMAAWSKNCRYNLIIAPTKALKGWADELERAGLYHEIIGYYRQLDKSWHKTLGESGFHHIRRLHQRMAKGERRKNRLGNIEPEFYLISSELLSLGDTSNQRFDLWHADYPVTPKIAKLIDAGEIAVPTNRWQLLPFEEQSSFNHLTPAEHRALTKELPSKQIIRVWSDRIDNQYEIKHAGWEGIIPVKKFASVVEACPVCEAETPAWSENGSCSACGHHHRSHRSDPNEVKLKRAASKRHLRARGIYTTAPLPTNFHFRFTKNSNTQYPAFKLLGKKWGVKIVDEVHLLAGLNTQHGRAIQNIHSNHTMILSGTLCRTYITEIEPLLCLLLPPASGQFPHAPWAMNNFREQFSTSEIENIRYRYQRDGEDLQISANHNRGRSYRKTVPEASNLTRLRAFIHGVHAFCEEHEFRAAWHLQPPSERLVPVTMTEHTREQEDQWIAELRSIYEAEAQAHPSRTRAVYNRATQQRIEQYFTHLQNLANGPEKLDAVLSWIREQNQNGHRCVLVGSSRPFYRMICKKLKDEKVRFATLDETTPPEQRHERLNQFRDSTLPNLVSRTRLINTNYNQLTCCTRGLFYTLDPSPSAMEQMKYRLTRPGQTNQDVEWSILISVRADSVNSITYEQSMYNVLLRKRQAIRETLKSVDRPRTLNEILEQSEERRLQAQLLEEILQHSAVPSPILNPA